MPLNTPLIGIMRIINLSITLIRALSLSAQTLIPYIISNPSNLYLHLSLKLYTIHPSSKLFRIAKGKRRWDYMLEEIRLEPCHYQRWCIIQHVYLRNLRWP